MDEGVKRKLSELTEKLNITHRILHGLIAMDLYENGDFKGFKYYSKDFLTLSSDELKKAGFSELETRTFGEIWCFIQECGEKEFGNNYSPNDWHFEDYKIKLKRIFSILTAMLQINLGRRNISE
jgi:hypothetical protein